MMGFDQTHGRLQDRPLIDYTGYERGSRRSVNTARQCRGKDR
jgi:hypothetical protein